MTEDPLELSVAFRDSIGADAVDVSLDCADLAVDKALGEYVKEYGDVLEGVPFVKAAYGVYKACRGVASYHYVKKLAVFINKVNESIATREEIDRYKAKFTKNDKKQDEQIEYLLIIIDKYVGCDKPKMLATLYLAFLDGVIQWEDFVCYSETLDRLLPGDYRFLAHNANYCIEGDGVSSSMLRLVGLGLMVEVNQQSAFVPRGEGRIAITANSIDRVVRNERVFERTDFGEKLVSIIQGSSISK